MKLGISALAKDLKAKIEICKNMGFNHIEIGIDNLDDWKYIELYYSVLRNNNISMGIHLPMELNTCEYIRYIKREWMNFVIANCNKAREFNVEYYNLHLGYGFKNKVDRDRDGFVNNSIDFFNELMECTKDINITIENAYSSHGDFEILGNNANDFKLIFSKNEKIGFCYDTGHNLIDKDVYLEEFKDRIRVVHLSDNDGKMDLHLEIFCENGKFKREELDKILEIKNLEFLIFEVKDSCLEDSKKIF